jgi:hypothetical protein
MKVFLKRLLLCGGISFSIGALQTKTGVQHPLEIQTGSVKIIDVSHHKGVVGERITLRFNGTPLFNHLPSVPGSEGKGESPFQEHHFFLPQTLLKGESVKRFVQQMNATIHPTYYVSLDHVSTPLEGYLLTVKFDSSKVGFQLESGSSPKGEPSITFTFYDRGKLQIINERHSTVLNLAQGDASGLVKKKYA